MIKLNVGGQIMITRESTLKKSSVLKMLIERNKNSMNDKCNGSIFLDEDPKLFIHVLNKLRHPNYIFPEKLIDNIENLLDFYDIPLLKNNTKNKLKFCVDVYDTTYRSIYINYVDIKEFRIESGHKLAHIYISKNDEVVMDIDDESIIDQMLFNATYKYNHKYNKKNKEIYYIYILKKEYTSLFCGEIGITLSFNNSDFSKVFVIGSTSIVN